MKDPNPLQEFVVAVKKEVRRRIHAVASTGTIPDFAAEYAAAPTLLLPAVDVAALAYLASQQAPRSV